MISGPKLLIVEVYFLGRKKFNYVTKDPPASTDSKYADWRAE